MSKICAQASVTLWPLHCLLQQEPQHIDQATGPFTKVVDLVRLRKLLISAGMCMVGGRESWD
uniref:Uncharacterized protein n=1 Tax=Arundo donax TaxID=35708 RepID=A0A0A9CLE8_ARUDO